MDIVKRVCVALIETVKETPDGAPGGVLFLAMLAFFPFLTAESFEIIMSTCCKTGLIEKRGECYFPAKPQ